MKDPWAVVYTARILGGQQFTGIHQKIDQWISKVPGAHYKAGGGISYINGVTYQNDLCFDTEEDLLAFKLIFAGHVV